MYSQEVITNALENGNILMNAGCIVALSHLAYSIAIGTLNRTQTLDLVTNILTQHIAKPL